MRQCQATPRSTPGPGEAGGAAHRGLVAPAVPRWFPEQRLPCITGKLVCIRMLGDASVLAFATSTDSSGLTGGPPIVDGTLDLGQACTVEATQTPQALLS